MKEQNKEKKTIAKEFSQHAFAWDSQ